MKTILFTIILCHFAFAGETENFKKDLDTSCNISKEARKLSKQKKYKNDPNALNAWIQNQLKKKVHSDDILKLVNTVGLVDEKTRDNIWKQTAADLGVTDWHCPGIGEFL